MGKMNELSQVITELRDCGKALVNMADSLQEIFSAPANEPAAENPVQKEPEKREACQTANKINIHSSSYHSARKSGQLNLCPAGAKTRSPPMSLTVLHS